MFDKRRPAGHKALFVEKQEIGCFKNIRFLFAVFSKFAGEPKERTNPLN